MSSPEIRDVAATLHVALSQLKRRTREAADGGMLTSPELRALVKLDRQGPMTTAELARLEQITPQAMGATVSSLEHRGLVGRTPDLSDGRRSILGLTPEGAKAVNSKRNAITDGLAAALENSFTPEEVAILGAAAPLIERLAQRM